MLRPREDTEKNGLCLHVLVQKETIHEAHEEACGSSGQMRNNNVPTAGTHGYKRKVQPCSESSHLHRNPQEICPMNANS